MQQPGLTGAAPPDRLGRRVLVGGWAILFVGFLALYVMTASRGVQWVDSGYALLRILRHEPVHPLGIALSHPLHHYLGRLFVWLLPVRPALAVTLLSALAGAVAVGNLFVCVCLLTRCRTAAILAAVSLGLSNTFWHTATIIETYTLVAVLLTAECAFLFSYIRDRRPWLLCLAALFNGLGLSNHLLAGLTTPVVGVFVLFGLTRGRLSWHWFLLSCGAFVAGSSLYGWQVVDAWLHGGAWGTTWASALFGFYYERVLNLTDLWRPLGVSLAFMVLSFPNLTLPWCVYGAGRSGAVVPRAARRALGAGLIVHALFALRYDVVDQHFFAVGLYVLVAMLAGVGMSAALRAWRRRRVRRVVVLTCVMLVLTPPVYAIVPVLVHRWRVLGSYERHKPYRDDAVYLFIPWTCVERSAQRITDGALGRAGENGLIVYEDAMIRFALETEGMRKRLDAVRFVHAAAEMEIRQAAGAGRPVILVPANRDHPVTPPPVGRWRRVGDLYVLDVTANGARGGR